MNKVIKFLKNEYKIISTLIYTAGVFGVVFEFANFKREYFWLGVKCAAFISAVFLFIDWINYSRQENYMKLAQDLEIENRRLLNQATIDRRELEEYFLLWVHQIKTPITVSNLILQKGEFEDKNKLKEQMFYIEEYTNMAINYLKLMDRDADMDITFISLDSLIKSILKKYSMLFIEKHISLDYNPVSVNVISDTKWLSILIEPILANAIKSTDSGNIKITLEED
ncbi:sensor histidine kinase [Mogibacterium sp.]